VNLAPAEMKKEGPLYDLPIAVGLMVASGVIRPARDDKKAEFHRKISRAGGALDAQASDHDADVCVAEPPPMGLDYRQYLFAGELALDGRVRPIRGALALAALAREKGMKGVVVPAANAAEAAVVEGVEAIGVHTLAQVIGML